MPMKKAKILQFRPKPKKKRLCDVIDFSPEDIEKIRNPRCLSLSLELHEQLMKKYFGEDYDKE